MTFARISQAAHYLPDQVVTNDDLATIMDTSDEWIASRTGIRQRRVSQTENTSDLATEVARKLLAQADLSAEDLDFILVATITPDQMMPSTAALVQGAIGATEAFAFDVTAACSGFTFALATADKLIASGAYCRGLVIGAEVFSKTLDWSDRSTAVLFGDGAGGVLLEACDSLHFLAESLQTDGKASGALQSGRSAFGSPFAELEEKAAAGITMNGRAVFDFAVRQVSQSVKDLLKQQSLEATDLDALLFHQANSRILDKMAKKLEVPANKIPMNLQHYGNTSAASLPILLSECLTDGRLSLGSGQTILLTGFGGGLTWGSLIVKL